jgi:transposase
MEWIRQHNRAQSGRSDGVRIAPYRLPTRSPWLNPIEPHWLHCKRAVYAVDHIPTIEEIRHAVDDYFDIRNAQYARNATNS